MKNERLQRLLRFTQWISLTFILVLGALMAHDAVRQDGILQAGQERLDTLKTGDLDDPALAQTVRDLDYLYRATYFQSQDRQAYGFLLLGIAFLVLCLSIVFDRYRFAPTLRVPTSYRPTAEHERKELLIVAGCGIVILIVALVALRVTLVPTVVPQAAVADTPQETTANTVTTAHEKIILAQALEEASHQWPQFRGSILPNHNSLPKTWKFKTTWKVNIPLAGFNSPVVWDNRIFVAGGDKTQRAVFCYDASNGKLRWAATCTNAPVYPELTEDTGVSAPTLCVDKARVYAIFATGEMLCCNHDGEVVWRRQLPPPDIMYGYASSPLLLGDRLIVQYDLEKTQAIYAIDVFTGKDLWKTERKTSSSWSSPVAYIGDESTILFVVGNQVAEGIDANTGRVLWTNPCLGGEVATSGVATKDAFYFSNAGAMTGAFDSRDGKILMKNENTPAPDVASPLLVGETLLLFTSGGSILGVNVKTGEELFEEYFDNGFYASPVLVEGKIVAVNLDGDLFLLNPSNKAVSVEAKFSLGTKMVCVPAFHQGGLIIRTAENELLYLESTP